MEEAAELALVADIGGTNARFALADLGTDGTPLQAERTYGASEFPSFEDALAAYLEDVAPVRPQAAALAVASPVLGDRIELTNRAWSFSRSALERRFGFRHMRVINDFAAIAHALPWFSQADLLSLGGPRADLSALSDVLAVVGPGTGLGVAALVGRGREARVLASEGGHTSFAPADDVEIEILRCLRARFGHVSAERLLSGPGLVNLHAALSEIERAGAPEREPADIVRLGVSGEDRLCAATLSRYCAMLGGFAGDTALMYGASRLFLGGGVVPRFAGFLRESGFRERFEAKGRFAALLRDVPVDVILRAEPGLLGAAKALGAEMGRAAARSDLQGGNRHAGGSG